MATLRFTPAALADLERLVEAIPIILDGLKLLSAHPLIGRPVNGHRRELLVFRGRSGYAALYSFLPLADEVVVLAVRHQREVEE